MTIEQLPDAELEIADAVDYYERQQHGLGLAFLDELDHGYRTILEAPERWPRQSPRVRQYRLGRFPYGIIYEVRETLVLIVAVKHASRHPGYWRRRL
jgi:plasmid stabilization system protein ParE